MLSIPLIITEGFRKLLSVLIIVSLVILSTLAILGTIFTDKLIQPQIWIDALENAKISEQIKPFISQILFSTYISGSSNSIGQISGTSNMESIAEAIIPADWVDKNLKLLIQSVPEWLSSPDASLPDILIDLTPIKSNLRSPQAAVASLQLFKDVPVCQGNVGQIVFLGGTLVNCIPEGWDLINISGTVLNIIADRLPDQVSIITLAASNNINDQMLQSIYGIKVRYNIWEAVLKFSLRIVIMLFCFYVLLQSKSMIYLIKKLPAPFYIVGIILLLLFGGWFVLIQWGLRMVIPLVGNILTLQAQSVLIDFGRTIGHQIQGKWLMWGFGMILVGITIQVFAALINRYIQRQGIAIEDKQKQYTRIRKQF